MTHLSKIFKAISALGPMINLIIDSTIFEKDLENHLKNRCNARHREKPACYSLNVNCTLPLSAEELEFQKNIYSHQKMHVQPWLARVQLDQLSRDELDNLINKVSAAYDANVNHPLAMEKLSHPSAEKKRCVIFQYMYLAIANLVNLDPLCQIQST